MGPVQRRFQLGSVGLPSTFRVTARHQEWRIPIPGTQYLTPSSRAKFWGHDPDSRGRWLGGVRPSVDRSAELSLGSGRQGLAASRGGETALQPTDPEADWGDGYHGSSREAHRARGSGVAIQHWILALPVGEGMGAGCIPAHAVGHRATASPTISTPLGK